MPYINRYRNQKHIFRTPYAHSRVAPVRIAFERFGSVLKFAFLGDVEVESGFGRRVDANVLELRRRPAQRRCVQSFESPLFEREGNDRDLVGVTSTGHLVETTYRKHPIE